jgi:aminopeptidase N
MLRDLIGIPVFNAAVVEYLATHGGGNADTDDFKAVIEAHHGEDLTWFFDQWLYGTGSPRLIHSPVFGEVGGKWLVQIQISQEHGTPTLFRLPLEVEITTTTGAVTASEWVTEWSQVLAFEVDDEPLSVTLDPDNKLLGRMFEAASQTAVDPALLAPPRLSAWPNPFSSRIEVAGSARTDAPATIDVFDLSGRRMRTLGRWSRTSAPLVWDGTDASGRRLPPGVFFLRSRETGEATRVVLLPD